MAVKNRSSRAKLAALLDTLTNAVTGRGRAFIDIGRPEVEGHGANLEAKADHDHHQRGHDGDYSIAHTAHSCASAISARLVAPAKP